LSRPLAWAKAILSLVLAVATAAIQLKPQMRVSPLAPIKQSQPFSIPFRIENTGYLPFYVDRSFCYAREISWGTITMTHMLVRSDGWDGFTLNPGESKTIVCRILDAPTPPHEADIIIVVDYRVSENLFGPSRKLFRFTGAYIDNWQWLPQPSDGITDEVNREIDELLGLSRE
jgi:hypothetical protein